MICGWKRGRSERKGNSDITLNAMTSAEEAGIQVESGVRDRGMQQGPFRIGVAGGWREHFSRPGITQVGRGAAELMHGAAWQGQSKLARQAAFACPPTPPRDFISARLHASVHWLGFRAPLAPRRACSSISYPSRSTRRQLPDQASGTSATVSPNSRRISETNSSPRNCPAAFR